MTKLDEALALSNSIRGISDIPYNMYIHVATQYMDAIHTLAAAVRELQAERDAAYDRGYVAGQLAVANAKAHVRRENLSDV